MTDTREDIAPRLTEAVGRFKSEIGYTRDLPVVGPYAHYDDPKGEQNYPHSNDAGCYVFANDPGEMLYVGKASRYMGARVWAPVGRKAREGEEEPFPDALPWVKKHKPRVWVIPFPAEHWWLAAALEGYFIQEFDPPYNKRKR